MLHLNSFEALYVEQAQAKGLIFVGKSYGQGWTAAQMPTVPAVSSKRITTPVFILRNLSQVSEYRLKGWNSVVIRWLSICMGNNRNPFLLVQTMTVHMISCYT